MTKKEVIWICFTAITLQACNNEIAEIRAITDPNTMPLQTTLEATYYFSENGQPNTKLSAQKLEQFEGTEADAIIASGGFKMTIYDAGAKEKAWIDGSDGKYFENAKKLVAWNGVTLTNVKGEKMQTEELIYLEDSARIYTEKPVTITTANGSVIRGKGMVSNDAFTKYKILQPNGDLMIKSNKDSTANGQSK
ncbi:MAG: LPS export ABC transporter periplasmic protein LptC [Flavobacteriales bacterium]